MPRKALYNAVVFVRAVQILEQPYHTDVSKHLEQVSTLFSGFALLSVVFTIMLEVENLVFLLKKIFSSSPVPYYVQWNDLTVCFKLLYSMF